MGQRRALGKAGGAAGELDIDGVVELKPGFELFQPLALLLSGAPGKLRKIIHAGAFFIAKPDDGGEMGQLPAFERAGG